MTYAMKTLIFLAGALTLASAAPALAKPGKGHAPGHAGQGAAVVPGALDAAVGYSKAVAPFRSAP